jgi:hypothetical protein
LPRLFGADRRARPWQVVTTIAGHNSATPTCDYTDGVGTLARFKAPAGITWNPFDSQLYVSDGSCIRKVNPTTGAVSFFAGTCITYTAGSFGILAVDGPATSAQFLGPQGLVADGSGNLYVCDDRTIRKIFPNGTVITYAGSDTRDSYSTPGSVMGYGSSVSFSSTSGMTVELGTWGITIEPVSRDLYLTDGFIIRKIAGEFSAYPGFVHKVAGGFCDYGTYSTAVKCYSDVSPGTFYRPTGIAYSTADNSLYIADRQCARSPPPLRPAAAGGLRAHAASL